jgi:GntR family transcriptional regulator
MARRPRFEEITDTLRDELVRGLYSPGSTFPTVDALAERFGVSRQPILNALRALRDEGWTTSQGRRTVVRLRPSRVVRYSPEHPRGTSFADSAAWHLIGVETTAATEQQAQWLAISAGQTVVVRRRTLLSNGRVTQLHASYLPFDLAEGTELAASSIVHGGVYRGLVRVGFLPTRRTEKVTARMPTRDEAGILDLGARTPVLDVVARTFGTADGDPGRVLEALHIVAAADEAALLYRDLPINPERV